MGVLAWREQKREGRVVGDVAVVCRAAVVLDDAEHKAVEAVKHTYRDEAGLVWGLGRQALGLGRQALSFGG